MLVVAVEEGDMGLEKSERENEKATEQPQEPKVQKKGPITAQTKGLQCVGSHRSADEHWTKSRHTKDRVALHP